MKKKEGHKQKDNCVVTMANPSILNIIHYMARNIRPIFAALNYKEKKKIHAASTLKD